MTAIARSNYKLYAETGITLDGVLGKFEGWKPYRGDYLVPDRRESYAEALCSLQNAGRGACWRCAVRLLHKLHEICPRHYIDAHTACTGDRESKDWSMGFDPGALYESY